VDKLGFSGKKWVGPLKTAAFEYVEYKTPVEPSFGFGGWRGLPNPLSTVSATLTAWGKMLGKLQELNMAMVPMIPDPKTAAVHPAAEAGLAITKERWAAEPNSWPRGGGGAGILHPGAVPVEDEKAGQPTPNPSEDLRVKREDKLLSMIEGMKEIKDGLELEFSGTNCATIVEDTGLPTDGLPPKTGSFEHLRALHYPSTKAVGFVRALLVLLGEKKASVGSWEKCRTHLCFRDKRNPWRNIHDRLDSFDPATADPDVFVQAARILRENGGEPAARKEWLSIYLIYKWTVLMIMMNSVSRRVAAVKAGPKRPRVEPEDLPQDEPPAAEGEEGEAGE